MLYLAASAVLIFTPKNSFRVPTHLPFLDKHCDRLAFSIRGAGLPALLPAARRLPTPGAQRLLMSSRHPAAIVLTALALCAFSSGVGTG